MKRRVPVLPESHPTDPVLGGGSLRGRGGGRDGVGSGVEPEGMGMGEQVGAAGQTRAAGL